MSQRTVTIKEARELAGKASAARRTSKRTSKRKTQAEHLARFLATPPAPGQTPEDTSRQRGLFDRHDNVAFTIRFPLAPTTNNYRAIFTPPHGGRARLVTSAEGRAYHKAVAEFWRRHWKGWPPEPLTGRVRLLVVTHFARSGVADLSNRWKALEDAMTNAEVYADDGQIDDERMIRGEIVRPTGAMDVTVETIG